MADRFDDARYSITPLPTSEGTFRDSVVHGLAAPGGPVGAVAIKWYEDEKMPREARAFDFVELLHAQLESHSDLPAVLDEDERLAGMFFRALQQAMLTHLRSKRRAMAKVVSCVIFDGAVVDESEMLLEALRDLDAPHFRALERPARAQEQQDVLADRDAQTW